MADIFLSYNREDQAIARRFAEAFAAEGFDVWWDTALRAGEAYDEVTEAALRGARAVVVLWSVRSVASRWVRAEATLADRNRTLVPVMIEACERPIMFELTQTADLILWRGDRQDPAWRSLTEDVQRLPVRAAEIPQPVAAPIPASTAGAGQRGGVPTLAVLPFTNRSGEPNDDVFAFGVVEDVVDALTRGVELRVISGATTARFCSGPIPDIEGMARQLGVRYLLEGNVRRVGQHLRVTTQLVDADGGEILWTQRFDRPLDQLSELQEDLVLEVAAQLNTRAWRAEIARALRKPGNLTAWEAMQRAVACYRRMTGPALLQGLAEARRAMEIDPNYAMANALVAIAEATIYNQMMPDTPSERERIRALAERAIAIEPDNPMVLALAGFSLVSLGCSEEALVAGERAVSLSPNYELAHRTCGGACTLLNRTEEAIQHFTREEQLAPEHPVIWTSFLYRACAETRSGRWDLGLATYDKILKLTPDNASPNIGRAICLRELGRIEEAKAAMASAKRLEPEIPLPMWEMRFHRAWGGSGAEATLLDHLKALWAETEAATPADVAITSAA
jgi:TolB-like protein